MVPAMNTKCLFAGLLLAACSGSTQSRVANSPGSEKGVSDPTSVGATCLQDARALRSPNPEAPSKIRLAHILIRHRELKDPRGATRSPDEACLRALQALHELQDGGDWDEVAKKYSDARNDVLGRVGFDELTTEFANAAFALEGNQLSYVVETNRGFHIILRKE